MNKDFTQSRIMEGERPKLKNPVMIIGLPGIGLVSKLAVDHLVKSLGAKKFAKLHSPHFPNQVLALKNGRLRPFSVRFYHKKLKKRDVVFVRGDLQPLTVEGQYEVTGKMLSYFRELGGKDVIAMAGYAVNKKEKAPKIYVSATHKQLFQEFLKLGCKKNEVIVPIVGMAGMVPTLSADYGMRGACLLVETPGNSIDHVGGKELVGMLGKWLGEKFATKLLEIRAKKAQELLSRIEVQAKMEEQAGLPKPTLTEAVKREQLSYIR